MINIEELLLPISENNECGEDLKYDHIYDQVKELRREDDPRLSQGIWQTDLKKANWPSVDRTCTNLLKTKTKDLQIAIWLLESWTVIEKFHGFNHGILLLLALCEKFWDDIYPAIDYENHNFISRLSPFYFLAEKVQEKIVILPIVNSMDSILNNYTLSDWMTARHNFKIKNTKGLSMREIRKSVLSTPIEFFQNLQTEIIESINNLKRLDNFIVEKCGNDNSPSFRGIIDYLEDIRRVTSKNIEDKKKQMDSQKLREQQNIVESQQVDEVPPTPLTDPEPQQGPTLENAYSAMEEIAIFLEKEQPQSPASTLLRIAGAIGKKNFQELLEINMKSGTSVMNTISELYRALIAIPDKNAEPPNSPK
ncbi:MAG: type VI secretion system protein TssA [Holosporaceae bacterium]|jgi:type VI secretion system protein ImpA|nr:type VI secretion system protein TssA [Holosporaceae bacterium]